MNSMDARRIGDDLWRAMPEGPEKYAAYLCSRQWAVKKREVLERANGLCERCKCNPPENVHHLTYARKYNELLTDLAAWCRECHAFTHGKSDKDPAKDAGKLSRLLGNALAGCTEDGSHLRDVSSRIMCPMCGDTATHLCDPKYGTNTKGDRFIVFGGWCESGHAWDFYFADCGRGTSVGCTLNHQNWDKEWQQCHGTDNDV